MLDGLAAGKLSEWGCPRHYELGVSGVSAHVSPGWPAATGGPVGQPVGILSGLSHFLVTR